MCCAKNRSLKIAVLSVGCLLLGSDGSWLIISFGSSPVLAVADGGTRGHFSKSGHVDLEISAAMDFSCDLTTWRLKSSELQKKNQVNSRWKKNQVLVSQDFSIFQSGTYLRWGDHQGSLEFFSGATRGERAASCDSSGVPKLSAMTFLGLMPLHSISFNQKHPRKKDRTVDHHD